MDRSRFVRAAIAGSLISAAVFLLLLTGPHQTLTSDRGLLSSFLDVQARSLLHGHLSVPPEQASIEGFVINGRTYLYFGLAPSLLRVPVLLLTHSLDGHLTQLSMLLAFVVLMAGTATLHWRVRGLLRPATPLGRAESYMVALMQVLAGASSVVLYLAGWPVVYHETELWGAALAIAGLAAALGVLATPSLRRIALAGVISLLAIHSRPSVGAVPGLALLVLAVGAGAGLAAARLDQAHGAAGGAPSSRLRRVLDWAARAGPATETVRLRTLGWLLAAALIPAATAALVEYAKFHTLGLPVSKMVVMHFDPVARAAIHANHGSLFGVKFVPTTLLAVLRPDGFGSVRAFPFIGFPHATPTIVGHPLFESVQPSLSATASMTLLCLLTLTGLPALMHRAKLRPLAGMLLGAGMAFLPVITNADIATRYLSDAVPLLVLGALIGLQVLAASAWVQSTSPRGRVALLAGGSVLAAWGIAVNGGAGLVLQRLVAPDTPEADRAAFVRTQADIDQFLARRPRGLRTARTLPAHSNAPPGDLLVLGRCSGLYTMSFGGVWLPVERTQASGLHELDVRMPASGATRPQALLTLGSRRLRLTVTVTGDPAAERFAARVGGRVQVAAAPIRTGARARVTISVAPFVGSYSATVSVNGHVLFAAFVPAELRPETLGADPLDPKLRRFGGQVAAVPLRAPICNALVRRARSRTS